jgi:hypothetical protein
MRMQSSLPCLARRVAGIAGSFALGLRGNFLSRFLDFRRGFPGYRPGNKILNFN